MNYLNKIIQFLNQKEVKMLLLIGFLFRTLLFLMYLKITKVPDSWSYMELSEYILKLDLSGYIGWRSPGYPLLIVLAFGTMKITMLYQFLIGLLTICFWYATLIELQFSKRQSFWVILFVNSFLCYFFFETAILVESFVVFIFSIIFWMLSKKYLEQPTFKQLLFIGLVLGFLVLIKPFYAYVPFLFYGLYTLKAFRFKKIINRRIIILIFPLMAYFGWSYVNKMNTGYFVSTTYFGLNISQNCVHFVEKAPEKYKWIKDPYIKYRDEAIKENKDVAMSIWYAYNDSVFNKYYYNFPDLSNELGKFGKETISNNQAEFFEQVISKSFLDFWKVFDMKPFVKFENSSVDSVISFVWKIQSCIIQIFKLIFVGLIFFYLYLFIKNRKITFELMIITLVFSSAVLQALVTFGNNSRFCFPFEFSMIVIVLLFVKNYVKLPKSLDK
jgi:4-amino-4-deoxy-L-arabinose transferase-like glycosyltransferase